MDIFVIFAVLVAAGSITGSLTLRIRAVERKADRLDRRLGLLLDHLGVEEPETEGLDEVRELVRQGKDIDAVRVYRRRTGAGLREAKRAVDALEL
jgi:ribosomal protein L7/L12